MEKQRITVSYATQVLTGVAEAMVERFGLHLTFIDVQCAMEKSPFSGVKLKQYLEGKDKKNAKWLEDDKFYAWHEWNCVVYGYRGDDDDALHMFEDYVMEKYDWLEVPMVHGLEITLDPFSSPCQPKRGYIFTVGFYAEVPEDGGCVLL